MFVPAEVWFCCLTSGERAAVASTAALFTAGLMTPIEQGTFESVWTLSQLYNAYGLPLILLTYGLEQTFIIIPDEPPIPAIGIVNIPLWLDIEGFMLSGGGVCVDGCDEPVWSR